MKNAKRVWCAVTIFLSLILSLVFVFVGCAPPQNENGNDSGDGEVKPENRQEYLAKLQEGYDYDFVNRFLKELYENKEQPEKPFVAREYPTGVSIGDTLYKGNATFDFWTLDANGNPERDATKGWYTAQAISSSKLPELVKDDGKTYLSFAEAAQIELFYLRTSEKKTFHIFDNRNAWASNLTAQTELFNEEFLFEFTVSANGPYVLGITDFRTVPETFLSTSSVCGINFLFSGNKIAMTRYGSGKEEILASMADDFDFCDGKEHHIAFAMSRLNFEEGKLSLFIDKTQVELKGTENFGVSVYNPQFVAGRVEQGVVYLSDASTYGQRFSVLPQKKDGVKSVVKIHDYNRVWCGRTELPWEEEVDMTLYPKGTSYGEKLRKGTTDYSFWSVDSEGNTERDGTKGWYTPTKIPNSTLPTLHTDVAGKKYLEFLTPAQIELFHLEGTNTTYHIFDNQGVWGNADAQTLFGREFAYEITLSATSPFVLGLTDYAHTPAKFADNATNEIFCGIHFLFEGNSIKMTRRNSGKVEAMATLDGDLDFADGNERKITFCITREQMINGRIRVFVDETFCSFVATKDYRYGNTSDGVMYLNDVDLYGQRFSVIPQTSDGKVYIRDFNRIKADPVKGKSTKTSVAADIKNLLSVTHELKEERRYV